MSDDKEDDTEYEPGTRLPDEMDTHEAICWMFAHLYKCDRCRGVLMGYWAGGIFLGIIATLVAQVVWFWFQSN